MNNLTGEDLYNMYAKYHLLMNNCGVDSWEQLPSDEQAVWTAMAIDLSEGL